MRELVLALFCACIPLAFSFAFVYAGGELTMCAPGVQITMAKEEGAKTVVYGGKSDVQQQYCGTVGGQSTDFSTIDSEIKTTHLKNNSLAPPDFLTNSVQGITWRLGFGVDNKEEPEGT